MNSKLKLVAVLSAAALTSACMQGGTIDKPKPMAYISTPDGCVVGAGTAGTSMDASFTFAGKYCRDAQGRFRALNEDGSFGPTVGGQALVAIAGTVPAATVQVAGGLAIAREKNRGQNGPAVVNQVLAVADSQANAGVQSSVNLTGTGCGNAPCAKVPMH